MSHVPLPVRVAVGLMVTALEQARKLPEQLIEFPVTAASHAVQAGMRVQQKVTELAIKGDQVFSLLRPVEDTPPWATFDEDSEAPEPDTETADTETAASGSGWTRDYANDYSDKTKNGSPAARPKTGGEVDEADVARALTFSHASADGAKPGDSSMSQSVLAGYDEMSVAQLRSRLRRFSLSKLMELLEYEQAHQNRPAFITLLSNRISTVRSQ